MLAFVKKQSLSFALRVPPAAPFVEAVPWIVNVVHIAVAIVNIRLFKREKQP